MCALDDLREQLESLQQKKETFVRGEDWTEAAQVVTQVRLLVGVGRLADGLAVGADICYRKRNREARAGDTNNSAVYDTN